MKKKTKENYEEAKIQVLIEEHHRMPLDHHNLLTAQKDCPLCKPALTKIDNGVTHQTESLRSKIAGIILRNLDTALKSDGSFDEKMLNPILTAFLSEWERVKPKEMEQIPAENMAEHWGLTEGNLDRLAHNGEAIGYNKCRSDADTAVREILK